jgi:hypothetical protein
MLAVASLKPGFVGRGVVGDLRRLPFAADAFDVALCSFALSYVPDVDAAFGEFSRVARRIIVTDLHPAASRAGWRRGFGAGGDTFDIEYFDRNEGAILAAAGNAGLRLVQSVDVRFDEFERPLFESAQRESTFERLRAIPAVWLTEWRRD